MFNDTFYPTPQRLITKMIAKIKGDDIEKILEPSAGKGDIVDALKDDYNRRHFDISAIEKDPKLRATLQGEGVKVIDSDFLLFSGPDKFDLIIANPPFDEGDKHLLKAIDIMYRGQIIFLLNAETLKNPCTNTRQLLVRKLKELGASIEYHIGQFKNAERKTTVEVALVEITIERKVEDDLFTGVNDKAEGTNETAKQKQEISTGLSIQELVAEYNQIVKIGTETLISYYRNYNKISKYIGINKKADDYEREDDLTSKMQSALNEFLIEVRKDFWRRTLKLDAVTKRMTQKKMEEFESQITRACDMDFTESNIRTFILNLINGYEKTLTDAVLEIFDMFTIKHSYAGGLHEKNIHYFNGWKTNKAFKVSKKVIIPVQGGYGKTFTDYRGQWELGYSASDHLRDIDIVMNYFNGMSYCISIAQALESGFTRGQSSGIESTYFTITAYKKGTIHLTFRDENILRRFNVAACKGKHWLPEHYGNKEYQLLNSADKEIVDSFENKKTYEKNLNQQLFDYAKPHLPLLESNVAA